MATNEPLLAKFGNELDRLAPGAEFKLKFRVLRDVFGKSDDAATEEAAREFGKRHRCTFRHWEEKATGIFQRAEPRHG